MQIDFNDFQCPVCKSWNAEIVGCPDNKPGCCVLHWSCPNCKK